MSETNELIPLEEVKPELFASEALDELLDKIETEARKAIFDMSDAKDREACASLAYKVSRSKTTIDDAGKQLVAEWKAKSKVVDDARKRARERLDALRDEVKKPLDDWKEEQARIAREAQEKEEARIQKVEGTFEYIRNLEYGLIGGVEQPFGILLHELDEKIVIDDDFGERKQEALDAIEAAREKLKRQQDLQRREREVAEKEAALKKQEEDARAKEAAEREERERKEREEQIRREEQERAAREKQEAEQRAKEAAEQAEREKQEAVRQAEERARREAEEAEQARLANEKAERDAAEKRAANKRRQASIKKKAAGALIAVMDKPEAKIEDLADAVVEAIAAGTIPAVVIDFS